jgi:glucose/arabinose dehydrogenase
MEASMKRSILLSVFGLMVIAIAAAALSFAQQQQRPPVPALGDGPWVYETSERGTRIRVSVVTKGLSHPWSLAFLPDGGMLVTERPGRLRIVRDGVLDPEPISGLPQVLAGGTSGLMDVALHPNFAANRLVYFTYIKAGKRPDGSSGYFATTVLGRGRLDGKALTEVRELFAAEPYGTLGGGDGSRVVFARDGTLFFASSHRREPNGPQDTSKDFGKVIRLKDDGTIPNDNPFIGRAGYRPEIYSYGHRTILGLALHPDTGALWETENGPQGGDEVNIIQAGKNYGWPVVSYGRDYDGSRIGERPWQEGMEPPVVFWVPSITTSGMTFYAGDRFPAWKGNLFVGSMTVGRIARTGHLERIVFNDKGEQRRESLLTDLKQRIRDVRQGPDGLLYVLTDEDQGALLRIEPAQ